MKRIIVRWILSIGCVLAVTMTHADESVDICFNYGCKSHAVVTVPMTDLKKIARRFQYVSDAATERLAIARSVGDLSTIAGQQTPIRNDKGGNGGDESALEGKMDCYDHAATTTSYLQLLQRMGWLKFHEVHPFVERTPMLFNYHRSASITEKTSQSVFVVDDWFFDNGQPAAIFPLAQWQAGAWPEDIGSDGIFVQRAADVESAAIAAGPSSNARQP